MSLEHVYTYDRVYTGHFAFERISHYEGDLLRFHLKDYGSASDDHDIHDKRQQFVQTIVHLSIEHGINYNDCQSIVIKIGNESAHVTFISNQNNIIGIAHEIYEVFFSGLVLSNHNFISFRICDCYACST